MSEFVWDWPEKSDGWQVGQIADAQRTSGGKFITDTITSTTERAFTCGCSVFILSSIRIQLVKYEVQSNNTLVVQYMQQQQQQMLQITKHHNVRASSTAQQQALSTHLSAVPLYNYIFFYSVLCKDIHFFVNILLHCL